MHGVHSTAHRARSTDPSASADPRWSTYLPQIAGAAVGAGHDLAPAAKEHLASEGSALQARVTHLPASVYRFSDRLRTAPKPIPLQEPSP